VISALLLVWTVVGPVVAAPQLSQSERNSLQGLKVVQVIVEGLDSEAVQCNLDVEGLKLAAARPLVDAGISVGADEKVYVYVLVSPLKLSGSLCVASVNVSARVLVNATLPHATAKPVAVEAVLWEHGGSLSGPASDFGQRVRTDVRDFVDRFATKVKLANAR
jgi:hypothetical protein